MSLDTYTNLKTSIAAWSKRTGDTSFATQIDEFIDLAEAEMFAKLRVNAMEYRDSAFAISAEYTALPTGFLGFKSIKNTASPFNQIEIVSSGWLDDHYGDSPSDIALYGTIEGNQLRILPLQAGTYDVVYYKKFDQLSGSVSTNTILTNYPKIYLSGCMYFAQPYLVNDARAPMWGSMFYDGIREANDAENVTKWSGRAPQMRVRRNP